MTPNEIEETIDRICFGGRFISVNSSILIIKNLTMKDKNFVNFIYKRAYDEGRDKGLLSDSELANIYHEQGVWKKEDEETLAGIISDLQKTEDGIKEIDKDDKKNLRNALRFKSIISTSFNRYMEKKTSLFSASCEKYASAAKVRAIIYCCTYKEDEERYWPEWPAFENETDAELVESIIMELNKIEQVPTKEIREIARSPQWRTRWGAAKKVGELFSLPIVKLDLDQQMLVYWSQVYDSAYEAYERPSDDIIENDELFDRWLDDQGEKSKEEGKKKVSKDKQGGISSKVASHGEIFVVANPAVLPWDDRVMNEAIKVHTPEEIFLMNDDRAQKFRIEQRQKISSAGMIVEKDLRNNTSSRMLTGAKKAFLVNEGGTKKKIKEENYL